jgi:hypothetical protein
MRTNLAQILRNIGIGWLVLVLVATFVMLALALSNGGPAVPYSDLRPFALLLLPGAALLTASKPTTCPLRPRTSWRNDQRRSCRNEIPSLHCITSSSRTSSEAFHIWGQ